MEVVVAVKVGVGVQIVVTVLFPGQEAPSPVGSLRMIGFTTTVSPQGGSTLG